MAESLKTAPYLAVKLVEAWSWDTVETADVSGENGEIPQKRRGGFFVFADKKPSAVIVGGELYQGVRAAVEGSLIKLHLIKRPERWPPGSTGCRLFVSPGERVSLYCPGTTLYALRGDVEPGDTMLSLSKSDFRDITLQAHVPVHRDGGLGEPFMITGHEGYGIYRLEKPARDALPRFEYGVAPLLTLDSPGGELLFPLPAKGDCELTVFRGGGTVKLPVRAGKINEFSLDEL